MYRCTRIDRRARARWSLRSCEDQGGISCSMQASSLVFAGIWHALGITKYMHDMHVSHTGGRPTGIITEKYGTILHRPSCYAGRAADKRRCPSVRDFSSGSARLSHSTLTSLFAWLCVCWRAVWSPRHATRNEAAIRRTPPNFSK